jgi:hypothetical protein
VVWHHPSAAINLTSQRWTKYVGKKANVGVKRGDHGHKHAVLTLQATCPSAKEPGLTQAEQYKRFNEEAKKGWGHKSGRRFWSSV